MIEILSSTALATVQDLGRDGYRRFGVGTSGAMDNIALMVGNILLGNPEGAAGVEIPLFPFAVRFHCDIAFALTGADCAARLDDYAIPPWWARRARSGQTLTLRAPRSGCRCYLTLAGGIDAPTVLGSRSTQLRGEFGGHEGRALWQGDVLMAVGGQNAHLSALRGEPFGFGVTSPASCLPLGHASTDVGEDVTAVRVVPAGEYEHFGKDALDAFWGADWKITPQSNRYGYRLDGPALSPDVRIEKRSHGIVPGVIQVPPSGQPIIQVRDAQTSGGYPKIGTVIEADLWRLGQARLGGRLRFIDTSYEEAVGALDETAAYLEKLRRLVRLYAAREGRRP